MVWHECRNCDDFVKQEFLEIIWEFQNCFCFFLTTIFSDFSPLKNLPKKNFQFAKIPKNNRRRKIQTVLKLGKQFWDILLKEKSSIVNFISSRFTPQRRASYSLLGASCSLLGASSRCYCNLEVHPNHTSTFYCVPPFRKAKNQKGE